MKTDPFLKILESIAPLKLAESWDNAGRLIHPLEERDVERVLLTIDLTEAVADEAIAKNVDFILSYHPILFRPANRFSAENAYDRTVMKLILHNITVYSPHTALDAVKGGVNDWLAEGVGDGEVSVLQPIPGTENGQGRKVKLERPTTIEALTQRIKNYLGLQSVRVASPDSAPMIETVALCAGAGTDAFKGVNADCYLTGEMSHHHILSAAMNGTHVILCEHTNTERGFLPMLAKILAQATGNGVDISIAEMDSDPIKFN